MVSLCLESYWQNEGKKHHLFCSLINFLVMESHICQMQCFSQKKFT